MMPFLCVNQSHVFSSLQCRTLGNIKKRLMLAGGGGGMKSKRSGWELGKWVLSKKW